jgi:hypothetical protein
MTFPVAILLTFTFGSGGDAVMSLSRFIEVNSINSRSTFNMVLEVVPENGQVNSNGQLVLCRPTVSRTN